MLGRDDAGEDPLTKRQLMGRQSGLSVHTYLMEERMRTRGVCGKT